jgi:hypothetical protein
VVMEEDNELGVQTLLEVCVGGWVVGGGGAATRAAVPAAGAAAAASFPAAWPGPMHTSYVWAQVFRVAHEAASVEYIVVHLNPALGGGGVAPPARHLKHLAHRLAASFRIELRLLEVLLCASHAVVA